MAEQATGPRRVWMVAPILIAFIAFCEGPGLWLYAIYFVSSNSVPTAGAVVLSIWLGWLWIASFITAAIAYRWKALWFLMAAPFALAWPAMWVHVARSCDPFGACIAFMGLIKSGQ